MDKRKQVIVATKNPVKIQAVKSAFERMFPDMLFEFTGKPAPSGVSDQPMTDGETLLGAKNRAAYCQSNFRYCDYWVGVEGGIEIARDEMSAFAWIVILSPHLQSKAKSASFFLPEKIRKLVESGIELGEADDIVFGQSNSKQKSGAVGLLTGDIIDRKGLYEEAVVLALIPFKNEELYS